MTTNLSDMIRSGRGAGPDLRRGRSGGPGTIRWIVSLAAILLLAGCSTAGDPVSPGGGDGDGGNGGGGGGGITTTFGGDVLPILSSRGCTACHGGSGGLTVTSVGAILAGGDHGPAVVPGSPDSSILVLKLLTPPPFGSRMPLGGSPLPDSLVDVIRAWIREGARDN